MNKGLKRSLDWMKENQKNVDHALKLKESLINLIHEKINNNDLSPVKISTLAGMVEEAKK